MNFKLKSIVLVVGSSVGLSTLSFAEGKNWKARENRMEARKEHRQDVRDFRKEKKEEVVEMRSEHREAKDAHMKAKHEKRAAFHAEMAAAKTPEERQVIRQKHEGEMGAHRQSGEELRGEIKAEKKEYWEGRKAEKEVLKDSRIPPAGGTPPTNVIK